MVIEGKESKRRGNDEKGVEECTQEAINGLKRRSVRSSNQDNGPDT